jgi:ABC-type oligopeptide transport system ATPase subunit
MDAPDTLECRDLVVDFDVHTALGRRTVHAVKGVDVSLAKGRVLGIVGE